MKFSTAQRALDYFGNRPMKIQFAGGEPLLNFDLICQVYAYVKSRKYDAVLQLQTNGTLIDEKTAVMIKKMQLRTGVSLDGPFGVNEALRGGTKQVLEGVGNLARAGVTVNLNATVTSENVTRLPELMDLALYLGNVSSIGLDLLRYAGRARDNVVRPPEPVQLIQALRALAERSDYIYRNAGVRIGIRPIEKAKRHLSGLVQNDYYCYAACGLSYVVLPDGGTYPCGTLAGRKEYFLGNINDGAVGSMALPSIPKGTGCTTCRDATTCFGSCPARAITNGCSNISDSLDCVMRKEAYKLARISMLH
jgi:uncharacterized protein